MPLTKGVEFSSCWLSDLLTLRHESFGSTYLFYLAILHALEVLPFPSLFPHACSHLKPRQDSGILYIGRIHSKIAQLTGASWSEVICTSHDVLAGIQFTSYLETKRDLITLLNNSSTQIHNSIGHLALQVTEFSTALENQEAAHTRGPRK